MGTVHERNPNVEIADKAGLTFTPSRPSNNFMLAVRTSNGDLKEAALRVLTEGTKPYKLSLKLSRNDLGMYFKTTTDGYYSTIEVVEDKFLDQDMNWVK